MLSCDDEEPFTLIAGLVLVGVPSLPPGLDCGVMLM